jgi:hypothetical protein
MPFPDSKSTAWEFFTDDEVRFPNGPSRFFYWNDLPSRRLNPQTLDRETALEKAKAAARAVRAAIPGTRGH